MLCDAVLRRLSEMQDRTFVGRVLLVAAGLIGVAGAADPAATPSTRTHVPVPPLPEYAVHRTSEPVCVDGKLDELSWLAAPALGAFHFPWSQSGEQEQTVAKVLWDDEFLYIGHVCKDAYITARYTQHNDPIPQDDCLEIMFAPNADQPENYYNIEWNVLGGYIDGHRPQGPKGGRVEWDVDGLRIAGHVAGTANMDEDSDAYWTVEVAIPLSNFGRSIPVSAPRTGTKWRVNFNRHGGNTNPQYSQWSAGDTPAPAFHVPHRFGTLIFVDRNVPFGTSTGAPTP